jgi:hypothetical protein
MHPLLQPPARRPLREGAARFLLIVLLATPLGDVASAADSPQKAAAPPPTSVVKTPEGRRPALKVGKRAEFLSAVILWCVILFVGLALVVMVMVWGRRLRRAARRQPTAPTVPDPLWYLKKNPSVLTPAKSAGPREETETGPDAEGRPTT